MGPMGQGRAAQLWRDENGVTMTEYVVATLAFALAAAAVARIVGIVLVGYLHRIYLVVGLPVP